MQSVKARDVYLSPEEKEIKITLESDDTTKASN